MRGPAILLLALATLACTVAVQAVPPSPAAAVNTASVLETPLPRTLSEYGFFAGPMAKQQPVAGVTPYRLNTALFSDGAEKLRFVYVPSGAQARADGPGLLQLPVGSALIKTFAFGEGATRRLIETRVLLHRADGWLALPYIWNAEQTEARLAVAGARVEVATSAGQAISYRVPNKNQCKECHGLDGAVVPIGPKARNLSHDWLAAMVSTHQLDAMPEGADAVPLWEARADEPAEAVARGYLDANCAHCHRPGAMASNSGLDLRWEQSEPAARGVMKRPVAAGRGAGHLLYSVVPGQPDQSILVHRMESTEPGVAMPELGKSIVDHEGVVAVRRWIESIGE